MCTTFPVTSMNFKNGVLWLHLSTICDYFPLDCLNKFLSPTRFTYLAYEFYFISLYVPNNKNLHFVQEMEGQVTDSISVKQKTAENINRDKDKNSAKI